MQSPPPSPPPCILSPPLMLLYPLPTLSLTSHILSLFHYVISNSSTSDTVHSPGERQDLCLSTQILRFSCHRQVVGQGQGRDIARLKQVENAVTCAIFNVQHSYFDSSQVGVPFLWMTAGLRALFAYIFPCKYRLLRAFACRLCM